MNRSWMVPVLGTMLVACGGSDGGARSSAESDAYGWEGAASADPGSSDPGLPPEKEKEYLFGAPEGSPNFVFIPSAGTDTLVKVNGKTLKVTLVEVGDRPIEVRTIPGQDAAVVLNAGSDDVSIVRSTADADDVLSVPVLPRCNAIEMSPDGHHAVIYYDRERATDTDPVGSFQAVSVVSLDKGHEGALSVSVGFRVRAVRFATSGDRALVVTDDGVSMLVFADLKADAIVAPIPVSADPLEKPDEREVLATPDGAWAVVRTSGKAEIGLVNLATKAISKVPLTSAPTDLDLLPDGTGALAVLRESKEAALLPIPAVASKPELVQTVSLGGLTAGLARITDDGKTAVLYTSVEGIEQAATLDLKTLEVKPVLLRKTVDFVVLAPGSRKALLVHKAIPGATGEEVEAFVDRSEGYTLYDLDTGFSKLVLTSVVPSEIAFAADSSRGYVLLPDPASVNHLVQQASLDSFMTLDYPLGSKPEHARALKKAGVMAVTQDHPSGRISFIDVQTGEIRTVTGYELNGLVK
jgi:DNA-binding beta-propeller fold protein YncE